MTKEELQFMLDDYEQQSGLLERFYISRGQWANAMNEIHRRAAFKLKIMRAANKE